MKKILLAVIVLLLMVSVAYAKDTEGGLPSLEKLVVSIESIDIPKKKGEFLVIYAILENMGKEEIKGVIQGTARFIIEADGKFYAEEDFGSKTSWMPPGRKYGPIVINTKLFRQIKKAEINPLIDPKANELNLQPGEHKVRLFYKLNDKLVPSEEVTIAVFKKISKKQAIKIAQKALRENNVNLSEYYVQSVEELKRNDKEIWHITFDLKRKLRQDIRELGGEIFVDVEKETGKHSIFYVSDSIRYGE